MHNISYLREFLFISPKEYEEIKKSIEHVKKLSKEIDSLYEDIHHTTQTTV